MITYKAKFSEEAKEYRMRIIECIDNLEICELPTGEICIKCDDDTAECVEYELRKAERRDDYCDWEKII